MEVASELFSDNIRAASSFIGRAINDGVEFSKDALIEISSLCDSQTTRNAAVNASMIRDEASLEYLYGMLDDEIIIEIAKKKNLKLPEELRDDKEEKRELLIQYLQYAVDSANSALECLYQAREDINAGKSASVIGVLTEGFFPVLLTHAAILGASYDINVAVDALNAWNMDLKLLLEVQYIEVYFPKLVSVIEDWFNSRCVERLLVRRAGIRKICRRINDVIREIQIVVDEICKCGKALVDEGYQLELV